LVSVLYKEGFKAIADFNSQIVSWMEKKNYAGIEDFRGKLAMGTQINPAEYERVQFMKTFSEYTK
jgi:dihydroorotate dehydrogenase (fumarate)